jgi:hypothetical protein
MPRIHHDERGLALTMAMLVLVVVSMLALVLVSTIQVETKLTGFSLREAEARNNAEAGIAEAAARIRHGDIPNDWNPRKVTQIFLTEQGSVPVLGADSLGLATGQPVDEWLRYSTPTRGPDVLTVTYKTNTARTVVYRYDEALPNPINTATGNPIYVVTSTGQVGATQKTVRAEIFIDPFILNTTAAVATNVDVKLAGNGVVCGFDHDATTPTGDGSNGRGTAPDCQDNENGTNDLPGVRCTGNIQRTGAAQTEGNPDELEAPGFYAGPWEAIGMTQAEFWAWIGPPTNSAPNPANGIVYLDNDNNKHNASGTYAYHGSSGEGFMYVDGSLTLNSTFNYRGIIYVEGDVKVNGSAWILGSLIVNGTTDGKLNGGMTVLYSTDGIQQALIKAGGKFVNLSWRELDN